MGRKALVLPCLVLSCAAQAAFSSGEDFLLPVAAAGAGGIGVANARLGDPMVHNPAALAAARRWSLATSAGSLGSRRAGIAGVSAALPVDPTLALGLSWENFSDWEFGSYSEASVGAAAAMTFGPYFTAGAKAVYHSLGGDGSGGDIQGSGVDLGVHSDLGQMLGRGHLVVGGALVNVVSDWPSQHVRRSVPVISKAAVAWIEPNWEWGLERHWVYAAQLPDQGYSAWKTGLEWRLPWSGAVRGGFAGGTVNRITFGLGQEFKFASAKLDYALITDLGPVAFSHRLGLTTRFGLDRRSAAEARPTAQPLQLIMEPGSRRVRMARLALAVSPDEKVESWSMEIRNKKGELLRVISGTGRPPVDLTWDGLDQSGNPVDADDVYYQLAIKTPTGTKRGQVLALAAAGTFDPSKLVVPGFSAPDAGPVLVPTFSSVDGRELKRLTIDFSSVHFQDVTGWQVLLKDENGRVVKAYRGKGDLPQNLVWDGLLPNGARLENPLGLRMEFSYTNAMGETLEIAKPVFTQESYETAIKEMLGRPSFRLAGYSGRPLRDTDLKTVRLKVTLPKGRALLTVNNTPDGAARRRRQIPRGFYWLVPAAESK